MKIRNRYRNIGFILMNNTCSTIVVVVVVVVCGRGGGWGFQATWCLFGDETTRKIVHVSDLHNIEIRNCHLALFLQ